MVKEEFEKLLQKANKRTVVVDTNEEDESYPHLPRHKISIQNQRALCNSRTDRQLANSTELPGHDNAANVMPKVTHCVSEILHLIQTVEQEVVQRSEVMVTPDDDKVCMTRVMFKT